MRFKSIAVMVAAAAAMTGCAVGPDFVRPKAPATDQYTATPMPTQTVAAPGEAGAAQHLVMGREVSAQWWTLFHSKTLDKLVRQALANSPTVASARAKLRQAEETLGAAYGVALSPGVDVGTSVRRQQTSGAQFGRPDSEGSLFNLYGASVNISYSFSVVGGAQRELESLRSQVDYQRYQLEAAYLTLTANIVTTAVQEASLREQVNATEDIVAAQQEELDLVQKQYKYGAVSYADLLAQQTQLAQTRASLPPLEKALAQTRHQLAVLGGRLPSDAGMPAFALNDLQLPRELPVSLPSQLVRQRPDVAAAESLMHEASANIGVATANMFPQISLTGSYGSQTGQAANLLKAGTGVWSAGAALLQPLFHGGELLAKRRGAKAAYAQAQADYRETVLKAFQNVADVLRALEADAAGLKAQVEAETSAANYLELAQKQYKYGAISYLVLLNAQRQHQQTRIARIQAQATRFADTAALFQALGGGWWNRGAAAKQAAVKTN